MELWFRWWDVVLQLRPACGRIRTFLWMSVCLAGMSVRKDLLGVSSIVRAIGLKEFCYDRILDFFHTASLDLKKLTQIWTTVIMRCLPLLKTNGRVLLVGDGLKVPKAGKKMPGVKKLHQESESNSKPEYIFGHFCQTIAVLGGAKNSVFAVPLASRIHDGVTSSNRDTRTSLDKMIHLITELCIRMPFYFIADAYYAGRKMAYGLLLQGNHLVTRVRSNAVAYLPPETAKKSGKRGRHALYGKKVKLKEFLMSVRAHTIQSPIYGDKDIKIQFTFADLLWRPIGIPVRFILAIHPYRGRIILMCTDLALPPAEIIKIYGLRFKIEISFKQSLHVIGAYAYHFWMKISNIIRKNTGNLYLHRKPKEFREAVRRKISAYQAHIQVGVIAHGLIQYLSLCFPKLVWASFGSWMRTANPNACPSERVTTVAMRNSFPEFLGVSFKRSILSKFLLKRIDISRSEGFYMVA